MRKLLIVVLFVTVVHSAQALPFGVAVKAGTLGVGAEMNLGLSSNFSLRVGMNALSASKTFDFDNADADVEFNLESFHMLLDWYPAAGGFRFSGGLIINNNNIRITSAPAPTETIEFNSINFSLTRFDGKVEFDKVGAYFGLGYGNATARDCRFHFNCDFGVMFHGTPEFTATAGAFSPASQEALEEALDKEIDSYNEDLKAFKILPVVSAGISFAF